MSIRKRIKGDTPSFFKIIGRIGIALATIGGALAVPVLGVPAIVSAVLIASGTSAVAVSQMVVKDPKSLN